jgi:hypothetical protein
MSDILISVILDAATGEVEEKELTPQEIIDLENAQTEAQLQQTEQEAKTAARASALAKLAELGLTEEEIAAL